MRTDCKNIKESPRPRYKSSIVCVITQNVKQFLRLDKSSIAYREADGKRDNTGNKTSTPSDDSSLIDLGSMGSKRSQGRGKGGHGSGVGVGLDRFSLGKLAHGKGRSFEGRASSRCKASGAGHKESNKQDLEGLHCR